LPAVLYPTNKKAGNRFSYVFAALKTAQ
jgi:hypothetical protein